MRNAERGIASPSGSRTCAAPAAVPSIGHEHRAHQTKAHGKRYLVPHPEFIMVGRGVVAILGKDDSVTTIDALHIVAVEDLPKSKVK
jgi:hypothetical protein